MHGEEEAGECSAKGSRRKIFVTGKGEDMGKRKKKRFWAVVAKGEEGGETGIKGMKFQVVRRAAQWKPNHVIRLKL